MKKNLTIILIIFVIILAFASYYVYNTRRIASITENFNKVYESFYNKEIIGTTLISIINKAIDNNEENGVEKIKDSTLYEENETNSIIITVKFLEKEDSVRMENIAEQKTETFVKFFATAYFKCTNIEYHSKTKQIKSMHFEQI